MRTLTPALLGMVPKFTHDCATCCTFLGHWYGLDVYVTTTCDAMGPSIVCRHGDDGPAYGSSPIRLYTDAMLDPQHRIGLPDGTTHRYADWALGDKSGAFQKAYCMGVLMVFQQQLAAARRNDRKAAHGCTDALCADCDH